MVSPLLCWGNRKKKDINRSTVCGVPCAIVRDFSQVEECLFVKSQRQFCTSDDEACECLFWGLSCCYGLCFVSGEVWVIVAVQ